MILSLCQGSPGVVHRAIGLLLHGQNPFRFFADFATLILHLASGFLSGNHAQTNLSTFSDIWAIWSFKVIGFNG